MFKSFLKISQRNTRTSVDDVVVAVWYEATNRCLWYSYNTTPIEDRNGNTDATGWSSPIRIFAEDSDMEYAGEHCQIFADKDGHIHIVAYDPANLDLVYAYLDSYSDTTPETCVVDGYGVTGSNLTLDVVQESGNWIPYIGYYSASIIKPKLAYKVDTTANAPRGTKDDEVTQKWELTTIPTSSTIPLGSLGNNKMNVALWKTNAGEIKNSVTGTNGSGHYGLTYGATCWDRVWGNGTSNPVLGYAIKTGTSGYIETAQKK